MTEEKRFCLTLDLENDWDFADPALDHLVLDHLDDFIALVGEFDVPLSVFVVGRTLELYPEAVDRLATGLDCEFHLHSYQHDLTNSTAFEPDVRVGMDVFYDHFGRDPIGYRAPQGNIKPHELRVLEDLGFAFDASIFPSYRPGTYNNLDAPIEPYIPDSVSSLVEIPSGTFKWLRIPTALSYFKLFGRPLSALLSTFPLSDVLVYNVHLHDLYRTASHDELDAPKRWIMKRNLDNAEPIFRNNIATILSRGYEPVTTSEVYNAFEELATADRRTRFDRHGFHMHKQEFDAGWHHE